MFLEFHQANAAGQKYLDLFHKTWKTYFVHNIQPSHTVQTSGFLGEYLLNIKKNGHLIHQENFSLDSSGKDITINLTSKWGGFGIAPDCAISTRNVLSIPSL